MDRIINLLNSEKPIKWLFFGDSITQGCYHTFGYRDYTELFAERLRFEMRRKFDIVINTAVSGNTSKDLYRTFNHGVTQFEPDVTFIMIGINDCHSDEQISVKKFRNNLLQLIDELKGINTQPVFQTPNTIIRDIASKKDCELIEYVKAIREICASKDLPIIDHNKYWKENYDKAIYWMNDAKHPNKYGHRVMANLLFQCFAIYKGNYATSKLFTP